MSDDLGAPAACKQGGRPLALEGERLENNECLWGRAWIRSPL